MQAKAKEKAADYFADGRVTTCIGGKTVILFTQAVLEEMFMNRMLDGAEIMGDNMINAAKNLNRHEK